MQRTLFGREINWSSKAGVKPASTIVSTNSYSAAVSAQTTNASPRSFVRAAMVVSAGALMQNRPEADLASGMRRMARDIPPDAVLINADENPLGLCRDACLPVASLGAKAGRYEFRLTQELVNTFAAIEGLRPEYPRCPIQSCDKRDQETYGAHTVDYVMLNNRVLP